MSGSQESPLKKSIILTRRKGSQGVSGYLAAGVAPVDKRKKRGKKLPTPNFFTV